MDVLSNLINLLSDFDKNDFKNQLKSKNKRVDVKNIQLFDFIKTDDIKSIKKLYDNSNNQDAYHALRKRLQDSLILYHSQKVFENTNSEFYDALRLFVVSRFFLEHDLAKLAFKCLQKAEVFAMNAEHYSLVQDILSLRLQYQHLNDYRELDFLIAKINQNQEQIQLEAKRNIVYTLLRKELDDVHKKGKIVDLFAFIVSTVKQYKLSLQHLLTYKSLYQILFIANEYAAIQQNYGLIEKYVNRTYHFIQSKSKESPKESHLYYHLYILYFLANFHLRSKSFQESRKYLDAMNDLSSFYKSFSDQFLLRFKLLVALNHHFVGEEVQAITVLQSGLKTVNKWTKPEDIADAQLSLVMFLIQQNNRTSIPQFGQLSHTDAWYEKRMGMLWTIRKSLLEIIMFAQFENIDLALSRVISFKRRYKTYLRSVNEHRVLNYVNLLERYLSHPHLMLDLAYQQKLNELLEGEQDLFNYGFIAWLIAKGEKKTSYEVLVRLVNF